MDPTGAVNGAGALGTVEGDGRVLTRRPPRADHHVTDHEVLPLARPFLRSIADTTADSIAARVDALRRRLGLSATELRALVLGAAVLVIAVTVIALIGEDVVEGDGIERADAANLDLFISHRSPVLLSASRRLTQLGSVSVLIPIGLLAAAWLWWKGARLAVALAPLAALGLAGVVVAVTKAGVARVRPPIALHAVVESDASFPSGHAADSAALYLTLAVVVAFVILRRPVVRLLVVLSAGAFAAMVALTRLELGVHWPTDVVVGFSLGVAVTVAVSAAVLVLVRLDPIDGRDRRARIVTARVHRALASPRAGRRSSPTA